MTKQEAIAELNSMPANGDEECLHCRADFVVCEVLRSVGCEEVAKAFEEARERVGFWYA